MFGIIGTLALVTWIIIYIIAQVCKSIEIAKLHKTFEKINAENLAYSKKEKELMERIYGSSVPPIISKYLQNNDTSDAQEE